MKTNKKIKKTRARKTQFKWPLIAVALLALAFLIFWFIRKDPKSNVEPTTITTGSTEMSADLIKANELTGEVFKYVELVETGKMTQEEADKLSEPVKVELENLRAQLSHDELAKNDAMRKALGDIMVNNVMKHRSKNSPVKDQ